MKTGAIPEGGKGAGGTRGKFSLKPFFSMYVYKNIQRFFSVLWVRRLEPPPLAPSLHDLTIIAGAEEVHVDREVGQVPGDPLGLAADRKWAAAGRGFLPGTFADGFSRSTP